MFSGVYEIRNTLTGDYYVGMSVNIMGRWREHVNALDAGKHPNALLQAAWNEHGSDGFSFAIRESISDTAELARREAEIIASEQPPYNIAGTAHFPVVRTIAPRVSHGEEIFMPKGKVVRSEKVPVSAERYGEGAVAVVKEYENGFSYVVMPPALPLPPEEPVEDGMRFACLECGCNVRVTMDSRGVHIAAEGGN